MLVLSLPSLKFGSMHYRSQPHCTPQILEVSMHVFFDDPFFIFSIALYATL
uniref:Uncharacterized protein n=1 Tax=Arundo donax TaxID=35708 RepID=A0A0A8ZUI2_ARUDO